MDFSRKTVAIVTGASKGIGREIAIQLSENVRPGSVIALIARSESGMKETKELMRGENAAVLIYVLDLLKTTDNSFSTLFDDLKLQANECENAIIFHNAGSLGKVDNLNNLSDVKLWLEFFALNVNSVVAVLNPRFMKVFSDKELFVVNITSLFGRMPVISVGMYGMAKAARDYYFKVLALEEPHAHILNYSPGPVDTDMLDEVSRDILDNGVKNQFVQLRADDAVIKPAQTVAKLMGVIETGQYKSGDIVDYYDN